MAQFEDLEDPPRLNINPESSFDEDNNNLNLTYSPPVWGLPTSSGPCLEALLYLGMAKSIGSKGEDIYKRHSSYYQSCKGLLPQVDSATDIHGADSYMNFLKEQYFNLDDPFTNDNSSLILINSLGSYVRETLHFVTLYMLWEDTDNQKETFTEYGKPLPTVSRRLRLYQYHNDLRSQLNARNITSKEVALKLLEQVLTDLSNQLCDNEYFLGDTCSSLDAVIGGELIFLFYSGASVNYVQLLPATIDLTNLYNFTYRLIKRRTGFISECFVTEEPLPVPEFWINLKEKYERKKLKQQRYKKVLEPSSGEEEEIQKEDLPKEENQETPSKTPKKKSSIDTESWLFIAGSICATALYIGWHRRIRLRIEMGGQTDDD